MKNTFKLSFVFAITAAMCFLAVSCKIKNKDYELLDGDWDRFGQYVVTFNDGNGKFKELYGGFWLDGKNAGQINIGEQCYRNFVKSGDNKWTGEIRIYNTYSPYETLWWENCTITSSGQALQVLRNVEVFNLTKKQ